MKVSGWGNTFTKEAKLVSVDETGQLARQLRSQKESPKAPFALPRGNGRSYGNQAVPSASATESFQVWSSRRLTHFLEFDSQSGLLQVEAGLTLGEIQELFTPRGWALAVTPGTQFVTVGGAIANDVHGKNHHRYGTFGEHVVALTLLRTNGEVLECSAHKNVGLFRATIGGMGLTGMILSATIQLRRVEGAWIDAESIPFHGLDDFWSLTAASDKNEYTVSWIDIRKKGVRGIFNRGDQSKVEKPEPKSNKLAVPFTPPISLFNSVTSRLLAQTYWSLGNANVGTSTLHYKPFFYPLDGISNWNRAYGRRGFIQHQALIPKDAAAAGLFELVAAVSESGERSAVSVLKTTAARENPGLLTYPLEGVTLALDFAATRGAWELLHRLDEITIAHGGRVNPSKHPNMSAELFHASFGASTIEEFQKYRDSGIQSAQSEEFFG